MQMIRTTITFPKEMHDDLRLSAFKEGKSLSKLILEKLLSGARPKVSEDVDKEIQSGILFFRKIARLGKQIDAAQAVREARDRDNA